MPLFLMGFFPVDFQEVKRPLRTKSVKRRAHQGGHATARFLEGFLEGSLTASAS